MENLKHIFTEGTLKTPQIDFNHHTGELIMSGRSIPENAARIYEPLVLWINEYVKSPRNTTDFRLNLDYFNTSTMIWLAKMIRALGKINRKDCVLYIHLYFDIEDFVDMDTDEIKNIVSSLVDNIGEVDISIGVKIYSTDNTGKVIKESTILI
ncbi:MAG TPA: SiaC family regulatory phosphoprotein [Bacteroidales bacterium]|nr:SiaC family regulatory phosphoprotein [Bacteroidales bacterium]